MVLSTSQQVALAFTAVLFTFVVLPRLFGVGGGTGAKETRFDPRYTRKGRKSHFVSRRGTAGSDMVPALERACRSTSFFKLVIACTDSRECAHSSWSRLKGLSVTPQRVSVH